jgi:hypothetical protein
MAYAIGASIGRRAETVIGPYMPDGFSQLSTLISPPKGMPQHQDKDIQNKVKQ